MFRLVDSRLTAPVLYGLMMAGSLAIGYWAHLIDPVINQDGVIYVMAGQAFLNGDFEAGFGGYKWPFFSMSIALFGWLTGLPAEASALTFNALMRGLGGIAFLVISRRFGANRIQLVLAGIVYLFCPALNELQSKIIRDFAFLACFLWMIVFFVETLGRPMPRNLVLFVAAGLLATAYRMEGLLYFIGLILYYLILRGERVVSCRTQCVVALVALPAVLYAGGLWITNGDIARIWEVLAIRFDKAVLGFEEGIVQMEAGWLKSAAIVLKVPIVLLEPLVRLLYSLVEVVSVGYVIVLALWPFVRPVLRGDASDVPMYGVWKWIVVLNLSVLVVYSFLIRIFNDRYPISLAVLLILLIPFVLTRTCELAGKAGRIRGGAVLGILGVLLTINSVEGLDRFTTKYYLRDAGNWIAEASGRAPPVRLYTNDRILDYYAGNRTARKQGHYSARSVSRYLQDDRLKTLDFLALKTGKTLSPERVREFQDRTGWVPRRVFENGAGKRVLVFDLRTSR